MVLRAGSLLQRRRPAVASSHPWRPPTGAPGRPRLQDLSHIHRGSGDKLFKLHRCIGVGGFGEVYQATMTDERGEREVAVKILHPGIDPTAQALQRLRDEARLLGILHHPSIIGVVDLLTVHNRLALVTEYVDGEDLSACFHAAPPPTPRALVEIIGRVAGALDAAWRAPSPEGGQLRLIHRDIKPSNIRISRTGEVKLLDFGLAHADHADREAQTATHALIGSFLYMAPERYLQRPLTTASDAFGLGCCLYEGLAGERLFEGRKPVDLYGLLVEPGAWDRAMDDRVAAIPSTVEPKVRAWCRRLLGREAEDRMSVTEVADTWEALVADIGGPTLEKWVSLRGWEGPWAPVVATLREGSVVTASQAVAKPLLPGALDDEEPTVRVSASNPLGRMSTEPRGMPAPRPPARLGPTPISAPAKAALPPSAPPAPASSARVALLGVGLVASTTGAILLAMLSLVGLFAAAVLLVSPTPRVEPALPVAAAPADPDARARLVVSGAQRAEVQRGRQRIPAGEVGPGMWVLWVDFGQGMQRIGTVRVEKGDDLQIPCDASAKRCDLPKAKD